MRAVAIREDIRDLILDAADRLLSRYGFKKMTMEDLAQEVGIAKGTIYLHFSSKEEVALARVDRVIDELCRQLTQIVALEESSFDRLKKMLILRVLFRFDSVRQYATSINEQLATIRPLLNERRKKHLAEEARIFVSVLNEGKHRNELFFKNDDDTARTLLIATNALLPSNLNTEEIKDRQAVEDRITQIAELLVNGLSVKN